jgi:predicted N-formylglutamate amidohydrolase
MPPTIEASKTPPVELLNIGAASPIVLACDHASRALPAEYGSLGLDESELWRHIAWDIGAADVTRHLAKLLDAPAVLSGTSRLLVDCNRSPDDPTLVCQVSDGTVVPGNRNLAPEEVAGRIARYHEPYHQAVAAAVRAAAKHTAAPAVVAVHSFTPTMRGFARPWHIGLLWDKDPRLALPLMASFRADPALVVGDNQPYSGRTHVGYTMARHGATAGLPHVLIEIRQDQIDTHHGAETWAERLAGALSRLLAEHDPFRMQRY